ncbi:dual specificity protein phosphatase dsp8-related [Anaeramoeba ignava]|uniref:Dual specificity protein phosphatase dsp8-related n=1 Tax=Anaeramoeba ignava TaxID=1746090 RepID=A0A9Q0LN95_ANAIG|nr:dual specificity protein phosphatase dsp8-related [Anaeramoeba ignava]|eukprot:Anaeramoba_ignava/a358806_11.p1 GENE.a358806_11~~a358806_11.p1  ORF type:complete len:206 (-),score=67.11 a358806_11:116-733(-)
MFKKPELISLSDLTNKKLKEEMIKTFRGPTKWSNWVIPDKLLASAYPGYLTEEKHNEILSSLYSKEISVYVNLMESFELKRFRSYRDGLEKIHKEKSADFKLEFLHFPIEDGSITDDDNIDKFTDNLIEKLNSDVKMLVHCWGGHGRTGTIVSLILGKMYSLSPEEVFSRIQIYHDFRLDPRGFLSPETQIQRDQVERILSKKKK